MSRDRRKNRESWDDDRKMGKRVAKHATKKHERSEFRQHIKDVLASGEYDHLDEILEEDDERNHRR